MLVDVYDIYMTLGYFWNLHVLCLRAWAEHLTIAALGFLSAGIFLKTESTKVARRRHDFV